MKIVQSFWSRPFIQADSLLTDSRLKGGWPHRVLNYYSWALSCLQLRQFYDEVELVTDEIGKHLLIEKMGLPYSRVSVELSHLEGFDPGLWNIGKLFAYSIQREPFLHVDSDVFIWHRFDDSLINAPLIAQNLEVEVAEYTETFKSIVESFTNVPPYLRPVYEMEFTPSCNAGIFGGNDMIFWKRYAEEVFGFIRNNMQDIGRYLNINAGNVCVVLEQVFFYSLAMHYDIDITYLLPVSNGIQPDIGFFHRAAQNSDYVHCVGHFKRNKMSYSFLEYKLQKHYPEYHTRINDLVSDYEI